MIHIVDYGLGNIKAFTTIFKQIGIDTYRATKPQQLKNVSKLILPGVGAFDNAMDKLNNSNMRAELEFLVLQKRIPILGVCVGMQMLANSSEEGKLEGLGWIPGKVLAFSSYKKRLGLPFPHMGWNSVKSQSKLNPLVHSLDDNAKFYFLHSYYFNAKNDANVVSTTSYGFDFTSIISRENIFGVQFHPEKSHQWGAALLENFARI